MAKKRISDVLIEVLANAGIERIYGITGDSLNSVNDSLRRNGKIAFEHVRHEETAAFAAGAEASLTHKLTVCAGSSGPGNLHLINVSSTVIAIVFQYWPLLLTFLNLK